MWIGEVGSVVSMLAAVIALVSIASLKLNRSISLALTVFEPSTSIQVMLCRVGGVTSGVGVGVVGGSGPSGAGPKVKVFVSTVESELPAQSVAMALTV